MNLEVLILLNIKYLIKYLVEYFVNIQCILYQKLQYFLQHRTHPNKICMKDTHHSQNNFEKNRI